MVNVLFLVVKLWMSIDVTQLWEVCSLRGGQRFHWFDKSASGLVYNYGNCFICFDQMKFLFDGFCHRHRSRMICEHSFFCKSFDVSQLMSCSEPKKPLPSSGSNSLFHYMGRMKPRQRNPVTPASIVKALISVLQSSALILSRNTRGGYSRKAWRL